MTVEKDPKPFLIKTIEEVLLGIISLIHAFSDILATALCNPSRLTTKKFLIGPLTFLVICLLLSSTFWNLPFNSYSKFLELMEQYAIHGNFEDIHELFLDTQILTKTLVALVPIIILIYLFNMFTKRLFYDKSKGLIYNRVTFYLVGVMLFCLPALFVGLLLVTFLLASYDDKETPLVVYAIIIVGALAILIVLLAILRSMFIASKHCLTVNLKYRILRSVLLVMGLLILTSIVVRLEGFFGKEYSRSGISCLILNNQNAPGIADSTINLKVLLTNNSILDQPVIFSNMQLEVSHKNNNEVFSANLSNVSGASELLKDTVIIRAHNAILFNVEFFQSQEKQLHKVAGVSENHDFRVDEVTLYLILSLDVLGVRQEKIESPKSEFEITL